MSSDKANPSTQNRPFTVHHQSVFIIDSDPDSNTETKTVDEQGLLALDDEPIETTLFHHGVDIDTRQRTSRIEIGGSDEFIDDRPLSAIRSGRSNPDSLEAAPGLQGKLFADTALNQRTLNGDQANARFMFEVEQRRPHEHDNDDDA